MHLLVRAALVVLRVRIATSIFERIIVKKAEDLNIYVLFRYAKLQ